MLITRLFKRLFQKKPKPFLLDNTFRIVPAFELKGVTYYMHEDPNNTTTGRGISAMRYMEELLMRCSSDYLKLHIEACDKIFSDKTKIDLPKLMKLNEHLKERVNLLVAMPNHLYRMASIVFFTKDESPYRYDKANGDKKIAEWDKTPGMYDFFCQGPLKTLMPFLALPESSSEKYFQIIDQINQYHLKFLSEVLSKEVSMAAS